MAPTAAAPEVLAAIKDSLTALPKAQLAHIAREVLSLLSPMIEDASPNIIVHQGEVFVFDQLDALLAKIEVAVPPASIQ